MLTRQINRTIARTSQLKMDNQPFLDFLNNKTSSLIPQRSQLRTANSQDIYVSHKGVSRDQATAFLTSKNITGKNVMVFVDASHTIGMKRLLIRYHYEKNIYKGHGEPVDVLTKENPTNFTELN